MGGGGNREESPVIRSSLGGSYTFIPDESVPIQTSETNPLDERLARGFHFYSAEQMTKKRTPEELRSFLKELLAPPRTPAGDAEIINEALAKALGKEPPPKMTPFQKDAFNLIEDIYNRAGEKWKEIPGEQIGETQPTFQPTGLYPEEKITRNDLVYRTYENGEPKRQYSDSYTERVMESHRKQREDLMNALARLGVLDQLAPKESILPIIPYRPIEPRISF